MGWRLFPFLSYLPMTNSSFEFIFSEQIEPFPPVDDFRASPFSFFSRHPFGVFFSFLFRHDAFFRCPFLFGAFLFLLSFWRIFCSFFVLMLFRSDTFLFFCSLFRSDTFSFFCSLFVLMLLLVLKLSPESESVVTSLTISAWILINTVMKDWRNLILFGEAGNSRKESGMILLIFFSCLPLMLIFNPPTFFRTCRK